MDYFIAILIDFATDRLDRQLDSLETNALKHFLYLCVISYRHFSSTQIIRGDDRLSYTLSRTFSKRDIFVIDCAKL